MNFSSVPLTREEWIFTIGQTPIPLDTIKAVLMMAFIIGVFFIGFQLGDFNRAQTVQFVSYVCPQGANVDGTQQKCTLDKLDGKLSWNCSALDKGYQPFNASALNSSAWR